MLGLSSLKAILWLLWVKRRKGLLEFLETAKVTTYQNLLSIHEGADRHWEPFFLVVVDFNFNLIMAHLYRVFNSHQSLLSHGGTRVLALKIGVLFKGCGEIAWRPLRFHRLLVQTT